MSKSKERSWQGVNTAEIDKQLASPDFINKAACGCQIPIFTFRKIGESLEGRIRPCYNHDRADRARAAHVHITEKNAVAIRLSKMLWKAIEDNHLWGHWIRITFKGKKRTGYGHAQKLYLVEEDKGAAPEKFAPVIKTSNGKSRKPREKRKISRPMAAAK